MKKLFLIVAAMFAAVSFSACSDDDDNGGKAPTPEKWVKQIVFRAEWDESWTTTITYDSENRVKKIDGLRNDSYEFTYNGNSLTVKGSDRTYTCKLNSDGYVTEVTENDFDKDETYYYRMEYKNGYLQRVEQRYSYNESRVRVSECTWRDGNLVEAKCTDYNEDGTDITTVKYSYSQTATPINIDLFYTVAASRRGHTTRLRQVLNSLGVVCYYTFSVKGFQENYAVFTPNSRSMQEQVEEKVYGRLTPEQAAELDDLLADGTDTAAKIRCFMRRHHLPFLATDRSVLNLPAIGKSMSFRLVGITAEGKRLLRFDHDRTRRHSPIIDSMGEIFIVENKSLAAYLRQLGKMGEDPEDYASIWAYTHGETEPRFGLYVYPDFGFATTDRVSNLELE